MSYYEKYTIGFWVSVVLAVICFISFLFHLYFVPISIEFAKPSASAIPVLKEVNGIIPRILLIGFTGCFITLARIFYKAKERHM